MNLEEELLKLAGQLGDQTYQLGRYRYRTIYERKPRLISIAPFRDRVVQHALMRVLEPHLDKTLIFDCYACRKGKGVHAAVDRYQHWAAHYPYVLHLDIQQYFASVDQHVLVQQLERKIKDKQTMALFDKFVSSYESAPGKGLPIGNLTSQFLSNYYLSDFDHWIKQDRRVKAYLRYVDDFFVFGRNKTELWQLVAQIEAKLGLIELKLHPRKIQLKATSERVNVLGYLINRQRRWLRNDNGYRFRRKLNKMTEGYAQGDLNYQDVRSRICSWVGHAIHGETIGLRKIMFSEVSFTRAKNLN